MRNGSFKEYLDQLVGWTVVSVEEREEFDDLIPTLRMKKRGFADLYVDVLGDPEGNGAGFVDYYHEEQKND